MKIYLLTHEREANRPTNTGQLAVDLFPDCVFRILWSRVSPDQQLVKLTKSKHVALIHPQGQPLVSQENELRILPQYDQFILLDATWQEAQKMFNRTPYLKQIETFSLTPQQPSNFKLRRNQKPGGLSTAECIIELFKTHNEIKNAALLSQQFDLFNRVN